MSEENPLTEAQSQFLQKWNSHVPLDGLVVTLDELRRHVPEHVDEGEVILKGRFGQDKTLPGYDVYGRERSEMRDAHGCPVCNSIVIGAPTTEHYSFLINPRNGRTGFKIRCASEHCGAELGDYVEARN